MDAELDTFKREINLAELAASYGYELDGKEYRTGLKMKHQGSTIIIRTDDDGHWVFFDVQGERSGSVIDFVMWQEGVNLGFTRKILREYTGAQKRFSFPTVQRTFSKPEPTSRDQAGLVVRWEQMQPCNTRYLEGRGINPRTIAKFAERIRTDQRGNTCFCHEDESGSLTGWEAKNKGFTGFAGGGKKALFMCRVGEKAGDPPVIAIAESAIDAMSYYQLHPADGLYVSIGGAMSPEQKEQLTVLLTRNPQAVVVMATDKDMDGEKYADFIRSVRPDADRAEPPIGKDWNDSVMQRQTVLAR